MQQVLTGAEQGERKEKLLLKLIEHGILKLNNTDNALNKAGYWCSAFEI